MMTSSVRSVKALPVAHASRARVVCSAGRQMWYPGAQPPPHLDGSIAGDYGFDPLRLATNSDTLIWYKEAELYNGRVAMTGVAGMMFTDAVGLPKWWLAGAEKYALDNKTLLIIELATWAVFEYFRYKNIKKTGVAGFLGMAPFDPAGMNSDKMQLREIKNGRLAMLAFLGFCSQAAVRGLGPIESLKAHVADPGHVNIYTSKIGPEFTVAVCAACITPIILEAKNSLDDGEEEEFDPFPL